MHANDQRVSTAQNVSLWVLIAALTLSGGCCVPKRIIPRGALNRALYKLSHWQENRCLCEPDSICHCAPVRLGEPSGYLSDGATLTGAIVAGPPSPQATDVVVGMKEQIRSLEDDRERLIKQLYEANRTIGSQNEKLLAAQQELKLAKDEYDQVLTQMRRWHTALTELDAKYRSSQRRYDSSLAEMEQRLRDMLQSQNGSDNLPPLDPFESMDDS